MSRGNRHLLQLQCCSSSFQQQPIASMMASLRYFPVPMLCLCALHPEIHCVRNANHLDIKPSLHAAEGSLAKQELLTLAQLPEGTHPTTLPSYPPLYLMAEASWLAYEEARVAHSLLTNANFGWVVSGQQEQVIVMEFVSVTYRYPTGIQKERPLNTQLVLFTKGNAVVLAFRGSQPISFFDWCGADQPALGWHANCRSRCMCCHATLCTLSAANWGLHGC